MSTDPSPNGPDVELLPETCPRCERELAQDVTGIEGPLIAADNVVKESKDGPYNEARCTVCDFPLARRYADPSITQQDDPLVDPEPWVYFSQILELETVLSRRTAQVQALKREGRTHGEIADILGIDESTVGEYSRRLSNRIEESIRTLEEIGDTVDPMRHLRSQFDGLVVAAPERFTCAVCGCSLSEGDDTRIVAEFAGPQDAKKWKRRGIYCDDCDHEQSLIAEGTLPTSAIVDGVLDRQGEDYTPDPKTAYSKDSLVLRDPTIVRIVG